MEFSTTNDGIALWRNFSSLSASFDTLSLEKLLSRDYNISDIYNMTIENLTDHILKSQTMENSRDSLSVVATITVFYGLILLAGILGNMITCTVISRNKSMHTATNYYLFNLAISDLILLLSGMPPDLFNIWYPMSYPFNDSICILQGILSETSANATVLTITAFTVERYIAICHPFRQHTMSKLSRAVKFILAIWVTAFILAIPQAMQFGVVNIGSGKSCTVKNNYIGHAFEVSGFVFFVGPMTAICVLYVLIGVKLKKSKLLQGVKRKSCELNRGISGQTRVIRMLIAVAVAFFLCWAPFHAQRLMAVYGSAVETTSDTFYKIYSALTYISGILYFLSTCINPLLYNIMSYKFRDAFKCTLARQFGLGSKYEVKNHNYSALSRNNGSIRLTTTVNNRHNTYNLDMLQKPDTVLSSQDCAKTRAHRLRCISISSQSTILTSLSKNDIFAANPSNRSEFQVAPTEHNPDKYLDDHQYPSFRKQRNSLPATPNELQLRGLPSVVGSNNHIEPVHHKRNSLSHSRNCPSIMADLANHNNNNKGRNNTTTIVPKHKTLETISEKFRRGTRKVFHLGSNGVVGMTSERTANTSPSEQDISVEQKETTSAMEDNWEKTNSLNEKFPEKNYVHCFL